MPSGTTCCIGPIGHGCQGSQIINERRNIFNPRSGLSQQVRHPGRQIGIDAVMDPESLAAVADQSRLTQVGQMARDIGLCDPHRMGNLADAEFPTGQQMEDPQPRRVGLGRNEVLDVTAAVLGLPA